MTHSVQQIDFPNASDKCIIYRLPYRRSYLIKFNTSSVHSTLQGHITYTIVH